MANDDDKDKPPPPRPSQQPVWVPDPVWDVPPRPRNIALYESQPTFVVAPPPAVSNALLSGSIVMVAGGGELTLTGAPVSVGKVAIANRDAILVQARSIELLLRDAIDREKEARSNTGSLPELQFILAAVIDMRAMLATTTSEADVGAKALSFKVGVLDWWNKDHVSILDAGYKSGLFILLMGLIVYFGLIPATIAATLINKDVGEALKQLVKLLKGGGSQDGQS
jgi:hypothetical protein